MGTTENVQAWSKTAATNSSADAGINWAEGQDPASVNNSARGMMAATKKFAEDIGGALAAGGTANALTVTTKQILSSGQVTDGLRILLKATAANTSATVTFAPDGLTAANIKRADGTALAIGDIQSGMYLDLVYNSGSSEWRCANIAPRRTGAEISTFSAHKNGSDQTVSSTAQTKVTFGTEAWDVGANFASSTWTPPAGKVLITARLYCTSVAAGTTMYIELFKNGVQVASNSTSLASYDLQLTSLQTASGSDTFEIYVESVTDSSYVINGTALNTYFSGTII